MVCRPSVPVSGKHHPLTGLWELQKLPEFLYRGHETLSVLHLRCSRKPVCNLLQNSTDDKGFYTEAESRKLKRQIPDHTKGKGSGGESNG